MVPRIDRLARNLSEGLRAPLCRFLDGSVGYLAPDAPSWQEAGEVTGRALDRAFRVLGARGVPAAGAPGNGALSAINAPRYSRVLQACSETRRGCQRQ